MIRKNWSVFRLRKTIEGRIAERKARVIIVTKKIFPGYLKSTAASRLMRKKEMKYKEDQPNELKVQVIEVVDDVLDQAEDTEEFEEVEAEGVDLPTDADLISRQLEISNLLSGHLSD
mmetsp:Transcript_2135/g.5351  ORF Transcript_2135/g.5351 Transcript_2135/m.5351 type:complete len:117 (+) Transcript_2135:942-1292(+)